MSPVTSANIIQRPNPEAQTRDRDGLIGDLSRTSSTHAAASAQLSLSEPTFVRETARAAETANAALVDPITLSVSPVLAY